MAYLGTPPRSRVLSSADIDPGSVSLDDISFTDQPASMNISGNIDKHTMRLADQVVVNGDLDITDNLILSKISDDGNAIILTTDGSTRTIEGAGGSLEASTLSQTPNASLTGMTGEIGSVVTGSPNLNLGNATFPAGHCVQVVKYERTDKGSTTSTSHQQWLNLSITYKTTNPLIMVDCIGMWGIVSVSDGVKDIQCWTKLRNNTTGTDLIQHRYMNNGMQTTGKASVYGRAIRWIGVVTASSGVAQEYGFYGWSTNGTYSRFIINSVDDNNDQGNSFLTITEIAQ